MIKKIAVFLLLLFLGGTSWLCRSADSKAHPSPFEKKRDSYLGVIYVYHEQEIEIVDIFPKSPAHKAGLQKGDKILYINGERLRKGSELKQKISQMNPGDKIRIKISRDLNDQKFTITLAETPPAFKRLSYH